MAKLKPCKTCGKEVAKSAKKCPHCGQKLKMGFFMKALIGIAALIVISIIASTGGGDDSAKPASTTTTKSSASPAKKEAPKPLSKEGVSSDVKIKVTGLETKQQVGNEFSNTKAQGIFKIVSVEITNNQKDAITVDANSFKLEDSKGREFTYSTDGQTDLGIADDSIADFFLKQLNPGLTQKGKIVFDVPSDAKGLKLKATGGMTGEEITLKAE